MLLAFGRFFFVLILTGVNASQPINDIKWLPCPFVEEKYHINDEGHRETTYLHREAVLQFGHAGDRALYPTITFLITASRLDMRRYMEADEETLQCEVRRYNTGGIVKRWPSSGAQDHDVWFTCTVRHTKGLFVITTFLRYTPAAPPTGQVDDLLVVPVNDRDLLETSASMVVWTRTPSVEVGFLKEPTLHCQFGVDHKRADMKVEWWLQKHGEKNKLFSYSSRDGKSLGSGVSVQAISTGNASMKLSPTRKTSEGTYTCSVLVSPLYGSHDIPLSLSEQPRVSISVGSSLSLTSSEEQKITCKAEGYYPLDVDIKWYREPAGGSPSPFILPNILFSSHTHHRDGTYSLQAFFLLKPGLQDSGYKYTCAVSHKSLHTPIRKSFVLTVTEANSLWFYAMVVIFLIVMLIVLYWMLPQYFAGRKAAKKIF